MEDALVSWLEENLKLQLRLETDISGNGSIYLAADIRLATSDGDRKICGDRVMLTPVVFEKSKLQRLLDARTEQVISQIVEGTAQAPNAKITENWLRALLGR